MAHQVILRWTAPTSGFPVVSYDVKRALAPGGVIGAFASIASPEPTTTTYTDTTVVAGLQYAYEVLSRNAAGESAPCPNVVVTIPVDVPNPPTLLTAVAS